MSNNQFLDTVSQVTTTENENDQANSPAAEKENGFWRLFKGYICVLTFVAFWEFYAIAVQEIQKEYPNPFVLIWLRTDANLWFFFYFGYMQWNRKQKGEPLYQISWKDVKEAIIIHGIYMCTSTIYVFSLQHTIVNIANTICMGTPIYNYILSVIILGDKITKWKNISITLLILGIVIIIVWGKDVESNSNEKSTAVGYLFVITAEVIYTVHNIFYAKWRVEKNSIDDTAAYLLIVGIFNFLFCWIVMIPLHYSGLESFAIPPQSTWKWIFAYTSLYPISILAWYMGIAYCSPLFMQMGTVLILPLGNLTEYFAKDMTFTGAYYMGMITILLGFCFFTYANFDEQNQIEAKKKTKSLPDFDSKQTIEIVESKQFS